MASGFRGIAPFPFRLVSAPVVAPSGTYGQRFAIRGSSEYRNEISGASGARKSIRGASEWRAEIKGEDRG